MEAVPETGFEVIDHTADVGIVAYGRDLLEVFVNAARGMFSFLIDLATVVPRETREVHVAADDLEGVLVAWLNRLLLVLSGDEFVPAAFRVEEVTPQGMRASIAGEPVDPARHRFRLDVKAATYHALSLRERDGGWTARVIFDV